MRAPYIFSDKPPFQSLIITLALVTLGFVVVGPTLGAIVASMFYDGDLAKDVRAISNTKQMFYAMLILQSFVTGIGLILFPYIQIKFMERKSLRTFFPYQSKLLFIVLLVALVSFNFIVVLSPVVEWNKDIAFPDFLQGFEQWARENEDKNAKFTEVMTAFDSIGDLLLGMVVIALIPAIGEELVFRGMIQNEFWRGTGKIHLSIWITAILFSAIHVQFYGFIPRLLLGALFGYLYYWSGNLLIPIFAHFFNNALSVLGVYLSQHNLIDTNVEEIESVPLPAIIFCSILVALLLFYLWRFYQQRDSNFYSEGHT